LKGCPIPIFRISLWVILALPGAWLFFSWGLYPEQYGYGHAIKDSGLWAAWLLMATLAVTPVRLAFRKHPLAKALVRYRRDLGVASFAYAAGHTVIYLEKKASLTAVLAEFSADYLLMGWAAFALMLPLAITSNDWSMRTLKRSWKRLHRLAYPVAILTFLHWIWSAFDSTTALINLAILAAIETIRLVLQARQRVT
jgi:sulfoxide reductase heme-binding subunit YedZ